MPRVALVPSKYTGIHFTSTQAEIMGKICLGGWVLFALGDGAFSVYGGQQTLQLITHTNDFWIGKVLYSLLGLAIAAAVFIFMRSVVLRLSTYYATHHRMMSDPNIHGGMVEEQPEPAVVAKGNSFYNAGAICAIVYSVGTNISGQWGILSPGILGQLNGKIGGYVHLAGSLIVILIISILISSVAHAGDFVGFHLLQQAKIRLMQENNLMRSAHAATPGSASSAQPRP